MWAGCCSRGHIVVRLYGSTASMRSRRAAAAARGAPGARGAIAPSRGEELPASPKQLAAGACGLRQTSGPCAAPLLLLLLLAAHGIAAATSRAFKRPTLQSSSKYGGISARAVDGGLAPSGISNSMLNATESSLATQLSSETRSSSGKPFDAAIDKKREPLSITETVTPFVVW